MKKYKVLLGASDVTINADKFEIVDGSGVWFTLGGQTVAYFPIVQAVLLIGVEAA